MYRGDGSPERLFDGIQLADPSNPEWQAHFSATYGRAAESIGFGGFHLDTYGFPRAGRDKRGRPIDMRAAYSSFLRAFRSTRPGELRRFGSRPPRRAGFPLLRDLGAQRPLAPL